MTTIDILCEMTLWTSFGKGALFSLDWKPLLDLGDTDIGHLTQSAVSN